MLTGFHGFHVTIGAIILAVILFRCMSGHFSSDNHFGFEAAAWYWHFVDVVWLGLFVFVYLV
jgi:cytochrome c oxidase subunit 3